MYTAATLDEDIAHIRAQAAALGHRWLRVRWWGDAGDVAISCLACDALKLLPVGGPLLDLPSYDGRSLTVLPCLRSRGWFRQLLRWTIG